MPGKATAATQVVDFLRNIPLLVLALLGGSLVFVVNPGFFWDDWVWVHQDPAENILIGKELGIWWAGYLSNAIYASGKPVLLMRLVALIAWAIASAGVVYVLRVRAVIDRTEGVLLFALLCATHVAGVRFLNSVAMYNVYIASFWIGCAFLVARPDKLWARLLAAMFFFFSFHLNSMLVVYALVLALLFAEDIRRALAADSETEIVPGGLSRPLSYWFNREPYRALGSTTRRIGLPGMVRFIKDNLLFITLPFLFYATIKFVSLALSTVLATQQRVYSDYNSINVGRLFRALIEIPRTFLGSIKQYFLLIFDAVPPNLMGMFVLAAIFTVLLMRRSGRLPHWSTVRYQLLMGFLLYAAAVYPYLVVVKPPILFDFYEARNVMPAVPGIVLSVLGALNGGALLLQRFLPGLALPARNLGMGTIIGLALSCQFVMGTDLLKDWMRQEAIASYLDKNKADLDRFSTIFLSDNATGYRISLRKIWNYEYTGLLINAFGAQTKLGISPEEYNSWPTRVPLVHDPIYRKRYNLSKYDPTGPQAIIEFSNSAEYPFLRNLAAALRRYWTGKPLGELVDSYFLFNRYEMFTEATRHMQRMQQLQAAIETYRGQKGIYPHTTRVAPDVSKATQRLGVRLPGVLAVPAYLNEVPFLRPQDGFACSLTRYAPATEQSLTQPANSVCSYTVECLNSGCGYLYLSDGIDYKLVYNNPVDMAYAHQAFPERIDPMRNAYGYWTPGAVKW